MMELFCLRSSSKRWDFCVPFDGISSWDHPESARKKGKAKEDLLLMEETLHQLIATLSFIPLFSGF